MQKYSLEEMREKTGMAMAHLVKCWREGRPVNGQFLRMEEVNGERQWWLDGGEPECKASSNESTEVVVGDITLEFLKSVKGIGDRAANGVIGGCKELGISTLEELAGVDDLTQFVGVGKGNGANLREALDGLLSERAEEGSAYPDFVYQLPPEDIASAKRLVDACRAGDDLPDVVISGEAEDEFYAWENEELGVDINCPYCGGLFDRAVPGFYPKAEAHCEADGEDGYGNCGEMFLLDPSDDGYVTSKIDQEEESSVSVGDGLEQSSGDDVFVDASHEVETIPNGTTEDDDWDDWGEDDAWGEERVDSTLPMDERVHPMLPECRFMARAPHGSKEWHGVRSMGIGSSDAGAILGVSPYASPQDVYKTKVGEEADRQPWLEDYAEFGSWFEPFLREWCEESFGVEIIDGAELGTLQSVRWEKALANIDGLDITHGVLEEYKTTSEKWTTIPLAYEAQVQHQMFVTGALETRLRQFVSPVDRALIPSLLEMMRKSALIPEDADRDLADWLLEHGEVHTWIVERDESYIERLIDKEQKFWDFVTIGVEPPEQDPDGTVDLSDDVDVVAAMEEYAQLETLYQEHLVGFCEGNGIDTSGRGSISGRVDKVLGAKRKRARQAIDKAVALHPESPKRITVGPHRATLVVRSTHSYWNIYAGEVEDAF